MKPSGLLLPAAAAIVMQAIALADGGTVQLRKEAGGLVITLFTSPATLSGGPIDISVLLQSRDGLEPVLNAIVSVILRPDESATEFREHLTREQARNKLMYAAPAMLSKPGKWQIGVTVERNGRKTDAVGILEVATAPDRAASY